jgi:hypothetical protein
VSGVDAETIAFIRERVAEEFQLPAAMAHRLRGEGLSALRGDAAALRGELGMEPLEGEAGRDRDADGRFSSKPTMNDRIRAASGRR